MTTNTGWAQINFDEVQDLAVQYGMQELGEARYLREQVGAESNGLTLYRMRPGRRTGFGHRHERAEELYVVLSGSGRAKVGDDLVELRALDVLRVAPACVREFEAGPAGMELLATGAHVPGDGEMLSDWWPAEG
jgi:uncharacterized cupin superfamily protein